MATLYSTGPALLFVGVNKGEPHTSTGGQTPVYLGTCEAAPTINVNPKYSPVMNDLSGDQTPYDMASVSEDGQVFGDLNVYNELVLAKCQARPSFFGTRGSEPFGSIGTLMITEGMAYNLWVVFPYSAKAVYGANGLPGGYRFLSSWLQGPDVMIVGTKANKRHVQFYALPSYDASTGAFKLYDHNMTGIPALPPITASGL